MKIWEKRSRNRGRKLRGGDELVLLVEAGEENQRGWRLVSKRGQMGTGAGGGERRVTPGL